MKPETGNWKRESPLHGRGARRAGWVLPALCLLTSALCLPISAPAAQREFSKVWKVANGPSKMMPVEFFQAESITFNLTSRAGRGGYALTNDNLRVVWEINGWEDHTNTYAVTTGTVTDAEGGGSTYSLTPQASNLPEGTYRGFVRALTGTNALDGVVLAWQRIKIEWSPDSADYSLVEPLPAPTAYDYPEVGTNLWFPASAARRTISEGWKTDVAQEKMQTIRFFAAEAIELNEQFRAGGSPIELSTNGMVYVWEINGWEDYTNTYALSQGRVIDATEGRLRFGLTPAQANLTPGTYRGFIRALDDDGTNLTETAVLAWQDIHVEWSPDSRRYNIVGPLTYPPLPGSTNIEYRISNLELRTNVWNAALQSEVDPLWASTTNATETRFQGLETATNTLQSSISSNESSIVNLQSAMPTKLDRVDGVAQNLSTDQLSWPEASGYTAITTTNLAGPNAALVFRWGPDPVLEIRGGYTKMLTPSITWVNSTEETSTYGVLGSAGWRPYPEICSNLVTGEWIELATNEFESSYPNLVDGQYTITFSNPPAWKACFWRSWATNETGYSAAGTNQVIVHTDLHVAEWITNPGMPTNPDNLPPYALWCDTADNNTIKQVRP